LVDSIELRFIASIASIVLKQLQQEIAGVLNNSAVVDACAKAI
jgi:hypothetical protein